MRRPKRGRVRSLSERLQMPVRALTLHASQHRRSHASFVSRQRRSHDASQQARNAADGRSLNAMMAAVCPMNDGDVTLPSSKSFDDVVRSYERRTSGKFQALMAHKKGISDLRGKQASFRTIANLLKQAGVNVSHDTVARFCRDVLDHPRRPKAPPKPATSPAKPTVTSVLAAQRDTAIPLSAAPGIRSKGPRIADPRNV